MNLLQQTFVTNQMASIIKNSDSTTKHAKDYFFLHFSLQHEVSGECTNKKRLLKQGCIEKWIQKGNS